MIAISFISTLPTFQGLDGLPLTGGYVYFGEPNQDPQEYPKTVYYDQGLSIPAGSTLRTTAGFLYRNGSPTGIWSDGNVSVRVADSQGRQVHYFPDWSGLADLFQIAVDAANSAAAIQAYTNFTHVFFTGEW